MTIQILQQSNMLKGETPAVNAELHFAGSESGKFRPDSSRFCVQARPCIQLARAYIECGELYLQKDPAKTRVRE